MFESIRRAREVKKAKVEEQPEFGPTAITPVQPSSRQRAGVDMGRRHFLRNMGRGLAATAAISAVPSILQYDFAEAGSLDSKEGIAAREKILDGIIGNIRAMAKSPDVRAALEGKGDMLLSRVFRAIQVPIDAKYIKGTKYDMSGQRAKHGIQIAWEKDPSDPRKNIVRLNPGTHPEDFRRDEEAVGMSNGIFWNSNDRLMTALHALEFAYNKPKSDPSMDLMLKNTGGIKASNEQIVRDDPTLTNEDIHGAYVCVEGIDPDKSADAQGYKSYPAVALRMGRGFADRVWPKSTKEYRDRMAHSFMIALPPGEAEGPTPDDYPARSMTGSPVWMNHNGNRVCAGILHSVFSMPDPNTGRTINIGLFHGVEELRAQQDLYNRSGA